MNDNTSTPSVKTSPYKPVPNALSTNLTAFLSVISVSEGTFGDGDNGYNVLVGGQLFDSYADHPRIVVDLRDRQGNVVLRSTAAGRYQEKESTFDAYKARLHLPDFGPDSQDAIAIQLLKETGALPLINAGKIQSAIIAASSRWASFPNVAGASAYGQPVQKMATLLKAYQRFGGTLA